MDITDTLAPNSDQLDAVDLLGSPPRIFTVASVSEGKADQPVQVHLVEFARPWRPGKTMRRVLAACWGGKDASQWVGRRVELFCDETVMFGGERVGGIRISRLSHIDGPRSVPIIVKRGKSASYKVDPLPDAPSTVAPANPERDALLADIKAAADSAGIALQQIADEWAASHDGQAIKDATDLGGLELVRDDLRTKATA